MRGDNEENERSVHNETRRNGPLKQRGEQSDSNVERTLGHVEPTMGGVVTVLADILLFFCLRNLR